MRMPYWKKVPSHMANTDKNYGLISVIRVYKKPELMGNQFIINVDLCIFLWDLMTVGPGGTETSVNMSPWHKTVPNP